MGCNSYISQVVPSPVPCGTLELTPCTSEQEMLVQYWLEAFQHLPKVQYKVWNRNVGVDERFGHIEKKWYMPPITLGSEFQWDKQMKEYSHGVWIRTSKTEMMFLAAQMSKYALVPKEGDLVFLVDRWAEVLSVNKGELIPGTMTKWLKWVLVVDTKQVTEG
jgi:hypothetical protein